jgi:hypothetical protein
MYSTKFHAIRDLVFSFRRDLSLFWGQALPENYTIRQSLVTIYTSRLAMGDVANLPAPAVIVDMLASCPRHFRIRNTYPAEIKHKKYWLDLDQILLALMAIAVQLLVRQS